MGRRGGGQEADGSSPGLGAGAFGWGSGLGFEGRVGTPVTRWRGLNPRAYLHWLFTRIAAEHTHAPHTLTPAAYAAFTRPAPATAQAA